MPLLKTPEPKTPQAEVPFSWQAIPEVPQVDKTFGFKLTLSEQICFKNCLYFLNLGGTNTGARRQL